MEHAINHSLGFESFLNGCFIFFNMQSYKYNFNSLILEQPINSHRIDTLLDKNVFVRIAARIMN